MHLPGVHARLDDLQRHPAADRVVLLGHVDDAHAPFADLLQQLVRADDRAEGLDIRWGPDRVQPSAANPLPKSPRPLRALQHASTRARIAVARQTLVRYSSRACDDSLATAYRKWPLTSVAETRHQSIASR